MKPSGIGGQAVIEGIMMRNKNKYSIAVRKPDNEIEVVVKESRDLTEKHQWLNFPIIRGIVSFVDSLVTGISTINYSASFYDDPAEQEKTKIDEVGKNILKDKFESVLMAVTVILSIFFAIGLFMVLPYLAARLVSKYIISKTLLNFIEGVVRLLIFVIYILLISMMKDIKRTFMYHGAEHKCINCIENGARLTPENVKNSSRYHKRCGTSFLFFVMFISIVFFIFIRVDNTALQILIRILLIPVIAGVSYEVIRWAGKNDNAFVRVLSKPGMWFQKLTTREPDMDMIEVAIRAVEEVFDWRQFIAEYYSEADNPVEALVASEAELAISGSLIHGNEETRTIDIEEQKSEDNQETELTPEQKYLQMGREMEFGMDDTDRESFAFVYEASDESESTVYDNSNDYNADDKAEELTEEEVVAGFEFETGKEPEEEQYPEDVPMFKQKAGRQIIMMTIREAVKWGAKRLRDNNVDNADHDSFELLSAINGMTRTFYLVNGDSMLSEENFLLYEEYIDKRAAHVPLQHILGKAYFYGYEFEVNEDVLIPRPDTEVLVGEVIKVTRNGDNILDMCTGSGCIGITLAKKFPESRVLGVDVSEKALKVAQKNKHNLEADNIDFMLSDLFGELGNDITFNTIVSNPPYIPTKVIETLQDEVRLHDPLLALDGTEDGLMFYRKITEKAREYLKTDGYLCYEIGAEQAADVSEIMKQAGLRDITVVKDLAGLDRVVMGRK